MSNNGSWHGGKGSKQRKVQDQKKFDDNWVKIFGSKKDKKLVDNPKK